MTASRFAWLILISVMALTAGGSWAIAEEPPHPAHAPPRPSAPPERAAGGPRSEALRQAPAPRAVSPSPSAPPASPRAPGGSAGMTPRARTMNGLVLDSRYNHGRYYAPIGTVTHVLPPDHRPYYLQGRRYYFSNGVWYTPRGAGFVVVTPPVGIVIAALPVYYTTVWYGGMPYYYADNTYYAWQPDQNGYAVVDPPDGAGAPPADAGAPPDASADANGGPGGAPAGGGPDFMIYPKNGQSREQQSADEYDCGNWAKSQTGFDPSLPDGGVSPEAADAAHGNFDRAFAACLQGRGYQLN